MSAAHVAIIDGRLAAGLLTGHKRVESRFARRRRPPYGRVFPEDEIHFKVSGCDIIGHAPVTRVRQFDKLTPTLIESLRRRYNRLILAPPAYWRARRQCRYGVLIWLGRFRGRAIRLAVPRQYGNAWMVLSEPPR